MARALIRFSLDGDAGSATRNVIVPRLEAAGFQRIGTFGYEAVDVPQATIIAAFRQVLDTMENPPGGHLDHLWLYFDEPEL